MNAGCGVTAIADNGDLLVGHPNTGRVDIGHELSLAKADERYQINCAFRALQLWSVDRTAAPNANLQLGSVDVTDALGDVWSQRSGSPSRRDAIASY